MKKISILIILSLVLILIAGCDRKTGYIFNVVDLPTDNILDLYSANEGIHPDQSVLEDPANPFADANLNMENVWDLTDECPSPKARFYLWATILANIPIGEYQYFTAKSLHELYTVGGSENARQQAIKAYRATLDHFFDSATWWLADWIVEETYYAVLLRNMVGESLYDPSEMNLLPLYSDPVLALADLSEWGYVYDIETGTVSRRD
ncbi:MAG: hypothetical protein R6T89_05430 [Candidatus Syntrophosphaera sp.]